MESPRFFFGTRTCLGPSLTITEESVMKQDREKGSDRESLDKSWQEIDRIDEELISLLTKRQSVAGSIGKLKRALGLQAIDPALEQETLRRLAERGHEKLSPEAIRSIFNEIISAARSVQKTPVVAFLGPEATFTHQAALNLFGHSASFHAAETIEEVFGMVEKGLSDKGVVPIENSYEGSVNRTLDLFYQYDLTIGAETSSRIRHHLLSRAGKRSEIKRLYSHPMAIAQCRSWLSTHLTGVSVEEVASTALGAKMASDEPDAAAIGGRLAGQTYGLKILEENIEDASENFTRFLVIGKGESSPTGQDKTSILFLLRHRPGALHRALGAIADRGINLTRIESRPMKTGHWEYLFFVDLEGHEKERHVSEALKEMEADCLFIKRLGSYPAGSSS